MIISYVNGICVKNDAISNSIRDEVSWLMSQPNNEVRLYAYKCEHEELPFTKVNNVMDIITDPHFKSSDLVVFHFGVYSELFNLLLVVQKSAKRLVVFHNITPKEYVAIESHSLIEKSFLQMSNIIFADQVICVSETNLEVLQSAGINVSTKVLPLAVHGTTFQMPNTKLSFIDGLIRIVFVGRFVSSKGPGELIESLHKILTQNPFVHVELDMIGNLSFSDVALLEKVRMMAQETQLSFQGRVKITIQGNATEEMKQKLLRDADIFVLPTYHEGFCVPIIEALGSGCKVIAYKNSNTPAISGGFAKLTPTGDVEALTTAIKDTIFEVTTPLWKTQEVGSYLDYSQKVGEYVKQYYPEQVKRQFLTFIYAL